MKTKNGSGPTDHPREKPINPRRLSRTANPITAPVVPLFHEKSFFIGAVINQSQT